MYLKRTFAFFLSFLWLGVELELGLVLVFASWRPRADRQEPIPRPQA